MMARDARVLAREDNFWCRKISEEIEIWERHPVTNRDEGYNIPRVFAGSAVTNTNMIT